jgi:hypothetical protein
VKSVAELFADPCPIPFFQRARSFSEPFGADLPAWWAAAPQGDWMLWVAAACGLAEHHLIDAAAACARVGFRFNPDAPDRLEPVVRLAERGGRSEVSPQECWAASDGMYEYQNEILAACRMPNVLSAAQVTGAVSRLAAAAACRGDRPACVKLAVGCATQVAAAGRYLDGEDAQPALHARCAEAVRARIQAGELSLPAS